MLTAEPGPGIMAGPSAGDDAPPAARDAERARDGAPRSRRPFWVLLLLPLVVGGFVRIVCGATDDVPTTDATAYLRTGESVWNGDGYRRAGEPELHFPPVTPVLLGGAEGLFGDPLTGSVVVMVIAGTVLLIPLAGVGRVIGGDRAGLAAAWVGAFVPALTTVPANQGGGSEGPYVLLVVSALWLALAAARRTGWSRLAGAAGAGALTGLAYLTRPEGISYAAVFLPVLILAGLGGWATVRGGRIVPRGLRNAAVLAVVFGLGLAVFVVPYVGYLHTHTGRWELTAKARDASLDAWRAVAEHDRRARDEIFYELDDEGVEFVAGRATLAELVKDDPAGYLGIIGVNMHTAASELTVARLEPFPAWELIPLPLLLLGAWAAWRARRQPGVPAVLATAALAAVVPLAFFVQPRYMTPAAAIACVFAGVGLAAFPLRWRHAAWGVAGVLLVFSLLGGLGGLPHFLAPREQVEHRRVGEWLFESTPPGTRVMTRNLVVDYYADRVMVPMPYSSMPRLLHFARVHGVDYVVADEYQLRAQRPQFHRLFERGPWPGLRLVHGLVEDGRITRVFALDPPAEVDRGNELPSDVGFVGDEGAG